jgi:hypothetical protein
MPRIAIESSEYNLIVEPETNVHQPAAPRAPERNYDNDYAAYWQARSGFFTPASSADRSRQRPGEPMRPGEDA